MMKNLARQIDIEFELMMDADVIHPDWMTQSLMTKFFADATGSYLLEIKEATYDSVRNRFRERINRYKVKPEVHADPQLVLPGFKRLQTMYCVERDGAQVAVKINKMTPDELDAKKAELRAMGAGCYEHADEIERYQQGLDDNLAA